MRFIRNKYLLTVALPRRYLKKQTQHSTKYQREMETAK